MNLILSCGRARLVVFCALSGRNTRHLRSVLGDRAAGLSFPVVFLGPDRTYIILISVHHHFLVAIYHLEATSTAQLTNSKGTLVTIDIK